MSEYGFQAFPNIESLENFMHKDSLYLYSKSLKSHQNIILALRLSAIIWIDIL